MSMRLHVILLGLALAAAQYVEEEPATCLPDDMRLNSQRSLLQEFIYPNAKRDGARAFRKRLRQSPPVQQVLDSYRAQLQAEGVTDVDLDGAAYKQVRWAPPTELTAQQDAAARARREGHATDTQRTGPAGGEERLRRVEAEARDGAEARAPEVGVRLHREARAVVEVVDLEALLARPRRDDGGRHAGESDEPLMSATVGK